MSSLILSFPSIILIIGILSSFGVKILSSFMEKHHLTLYILSLGLFLGLSFVSFVMLLLGVFGLLYFESAILVVLFMFVISYTTCKKVFFFLWQNSRYVYHKFQEMNSFQKGISILLGSIIFIVFFASFTPPVGWDALNYHLAVPKIYAQNHSIIFTPSIWHSRFPLFVQFQYLFGILLHLDVFSQVLSFVLGVIGAVLFYELLRSLFSKEYSLLGFFLLVGMPLYWFVMPEAHIEAESLFVMILLLSLLKNIFIKKNILIIDYVLLGLLSGALISAKYSHIPFVGIILLLSYMVLWRKNKWSFLKAFQIFGVVFATLSIFVLPWYMKTWIELGNPIFPYTFTQNGFHVAHSANMERIFDQSLSKSPVMKTVTDFFISLVSMTFSPEKFGGDVPKIGPMYLILFPIPLIIFIWSFFFEKLKLWRNRDLFILTSLTVFLGWAIWFFVLHGTRYFFVFFPVIIFWIVLGISVLSWRDIYNKKFLKILFGGSILLLLSYNLFIVIKLHGEKFRFFFPKTSRVEYLSNYIEPGTFDKKGVSEFGAYTYANRELLSSDSILLLGEFRGYYLDIPYIWGRPDLQDEVLYSKFKSDDAIQSILLELGITHVMYPSQISKNHEEPHYVYDEGYNYFVVHFLPEYCQVVYTDERYELCLIQSEKF